MRQIIFEGILICLLRHCLHMKVLHECVLCISSLECEQFIQGCFNFRCLFLPEHCLYSCRWDGTCIFLLLPCWLSLEFTQF